MIDDRSPNEPGVERDPLLNGIVDEPEETGEPFIDHDPDGPGGPLLPNGKFDIGEFFFDLTNGGTVPTDDETEYNGPRDTLWQGLTGEQIFFNYNYGGDFTDGRLLDGNNDGDYDDAEDGRLRFSGIIQRQTYARQLYCLMMLLMDEEYVASQNMRPDDKGDIAFLDSKGNFDMFVLHQQLALEMATEALWAKGDLNPSTDVTSVAFKTLLGDEIAKAKQSGSQIPCLPVDAPQTHGSADCPMGDQLRRLPRRRLGDDALRVRRESFRRLGLHGIRPRRHDQVLGQASPHSTTTSPPTKTGATISRRRENSIRPSRSTRIGRALTTTSTTTCRPSGSTRTEQSSVSRPRATSSGAPNVPSS